MPRERKVSEIVETRQPGGQPPSILPAGLPFPKKRD
jgi:hypothetical protein